MIKKILFMLVVFTCVLVSIGADYSKQEFKYQYIKTSYTDKIEIKKIIYTKEDLFNLYSEYKEVLDLEHREVVYSDNTIGFIDAITEYNDEFFENNNLVIVYFTSSSGSISYETKNIEVEDDNLNIEIIEKNSEYYSCDMSGILLLVEIENTLDLNIINLIKAK